MHRYLVPFHPKRVPHFFTDVLIIGGGLAGLRSAIAIDRRLSTLVVSKDNFLHSNSQYAQGGIASVLDPEDRFEDHVRDTLTAGGNLCDPAVVEMVVRESPERVRELIHWGTRFDQEDGEIALGREGGHSHNRIVHALGDATGKEVMRAVLDYTRALPNLECWPQTFTIDLLTHADRCRGALVWNAEHGKTFIWAKQTILCTGGAGQIYRETTNPEAATGDGLAIAYRAGAELRDMEFMQFHPTVLYIAGSSRNLITEAIRGAGAHLVDRSNYRFMSDYDSRLELAPRDVVSRAIVNQMEKTRHPNVYLNLSHLDPDMVRSKFPGIRAMCAEFGLDITRDPIPVRPGAHYMIGGITVDLQGRTGVPNLWAAGEVTSTGLHGANRLASNSLLEALVFGAHVGEQVSELAASHDHDFRPIPIENAKLAEQTMSEPLDLSDIRNSLKSLMWRSAGVRRDGPALQEAKEDIDRWCKYVLSKQFNTVGGWELQNMLIVSRLIIQAALARTETRGVHVRTDYPATDDTHWRRHLQFRWEGG
ncbi:MAG: L-aspartate oxidase [Pirellulales bacterium]|nr:L-aspartate oxidase [Pirellulales bacterium]